jgi:5-methylcytosine-specific restriction endonuclease McrA
MSKNVKRCLKEPISEISLAADLLSQAVRAHFDGDSILAEHLFQKADIPAIRDWTESIWGPMGVYSQLVKTLGNPKTLPKNERDSVRMPTKSLEIELLKRDGFNCRFCGIPLIRKETRVFFHKKYPNAVRWGKTNTEQHAAFQAMWMQFDHLIPHARGGKTSKDNLLITCAPCNYGRMNFLVDEIGLFKPNTDIENLSTWVGLEMGLILE